MKKYLHFVLILLCIIGTSRIADAQPGNQNFETLSEGNIPVPTMSVTVGDMVYSVVSPVLNTFQTLNGTPAASLSVQYPGLAGGGLFYKSSRMLVLNQNFEGLNGGKYQSDGMGGSYATGAADLRMATVSGEEFKISSFYIDPGYSNFDAFYSYQSVVIAGYRDGTQVATAIMSDFEINTTAGYGQNAAAYTIYAPGAGGGILTFTGSNWSNIDEIRFTSVIPVCLGLDDIVFSAPVAGPTLTTTAVTVFGTDTAVVGGNVTADGGSTVTDRGVVYSSTNNPPLITDNKTSIGSGIGSFSKTITGLTPGTLYYVRAFGTNSTATTFGPVQTFTTVSNNNNLSNLTLSAGTLSPTFTSGTLTYTASVLNATSSINITPTAAHAGATITVNGNSVASGNASTVSLSVGANTITVRVTAQNGLTKDYTVTVTRAVSSDNNLSNLTLSTGTLNPVFASGTVSYTASVSNATTSVDVTPTVADATASVTVNGNSVVSGNASTVALNVGANTITVRVTAQNSSTKDYTVTVTRAASANNNLSNLTLGTGTLNPVFASGTVSYTASVSNATTSVDVTPTVADATASVTVNGNAAVSGNASTVSLNVGANTITVQVTAQDNSTRDYTVTVTRAASSNNNLSNLTISSGTLNPVFASGTVSYTASVSNATTSVDVAPTVADATASVTVNGNAAVSGNASTVSLNVGANIITVQVTAQDNSTKDYTVTVTREPDGQVSAIVRAGSNPSNASSLDYTVTFNRNVTGLSTSNFSLTETGDVSGAGIASLSGSGATYTVSVNTGSGNGSIRLDLADVTGILPPIGTSMPFTGETYTIDKTAPGLDVVSIASNNANPALARSGDVLTLTFTSDEAIASPVVSISGQTVSATDLGGDNWSAVYTMLNSDAEGTVSFSIAYQDLAGNAGTTITGTTDASSVTFDRTAPAVPANLQVVSGNGKNTLSWTANAESDLASYKIYGGTSSDPVTLIATVTPPDVSYVHSGLTNGTTYYYRMVAADITGNASGYTSSVSSVPQAPQTITFVLASPVTYGTPDFDPGASSDNNTIPVTYSSDDEDVVKIVSGEIHIVGVGTATITASQAGNAAFIAAADVTQSLTVQAKDITLALNASPVITRAYNGNTTATLAAGNYILTGVEPGDDVMVSGTANYDTKEIGAGKTITANTFVLAGTHAANYNLTTANAATTGSITKKDITLALNASPAITKTYDQSTTAILAAGNYTLTGVETGEDVTVSGTATYDTESAGALKTVTAVSFVLAGAESGNYNLTTTSQTTTGSITKKDITLALNASPAITKIYNGNTTATLAAGNYTLTGVESGDDVMVSGTANYDTKTVGTGKTITVNTFVLAGAESGNYNLTTTSETTTGTITKKDISLSLNASPAITKTYDQSASATLAAGNYTLNGIETGDDVTVSGTANYDTKTVGTGKTITVNTFVLAGAESGNYNLTTTSETTTGAITKKDISLSLNASPAITKTYDQSTTAILAAGNYTLTGVETGDDVTVSGTANYDTKAVGTGKTITVNTFVLAGTESGNYNLTTTSETTTGTITKKDLSLSLNASPVITKTYDQSTIAILAAGNYTLTGVETGDDVTVSGTASYDTRTVGAGKTITVNTFVLTGAESGNYNLTTTSETTTGTITKKDISLSLNASPAITKTYDQSTTATLASGNYTLTGIESGDDVTVSGTANYDTKTVGTGKTITANTFVLAGAESGNYNLTTTSEMTTGTITKKDISLSLNVSPAITKIYNGNTTATLVAGNYTLTGIETGDDVTVSGTANYDTKTVGTGKTITVNTFVLAGAESGNYNLTTTSETTTGAITKKDITLTLNASPAITKIYNGNATATLATGNYTLNGVESGDVVTVSGTANYDTKTVGTGKTITVNTFVLAGAESGNYNLTTTSETTTGSITKKDITLALNVSPAITKVYNGNTAATLVSGNYTLTGIESGDAVTVSGTANYDTKTVGTGKTITVNTFVLAGAESGNYNLTTTSETTTGTITKKDITLTLNVSPAITKVYNGNTTATLAAGNYTLSGIESGDAVTVSGTASYDTRTVGTGKTITVNTFVLAGTESGNYNLTTTNQTTTGAITKKDITLTLNASPAITKVYNGSTIATLASGNYTLTGIESGDDVTVSGTASYDTKTVGTGKTITVNTFVLAGAESGNYNLTMTSQTTTGTITKKDITLALNVSPAITKIYNGNATATLVSDNYSLAGVESGDAVTVSGTANYDTKAVGTGKTITVNTFVLAGAESGNYNLTTTSETITGSITQKDITLVLNATPAVSKVYDGTVSATLASGNYTLNGIETGDAVTVSGTAVYDTKEVGTGKTITANTFVLAGAESGNYNLTTASATVTGSVTKKDISVTLNAAPLITKVYNGSAAATLAAANYSLQGLEAGDVVTVTGTAVYDSRDAGLNKAVMVNAFVLAGAQSGNYNLTTTSVVTTGDITTKNITASLNASPLVTKVYDGNANATLAPANYSLQGVEAGDDVTVSGNAVYTDKTAGTGKAVTVSSLLLAGAEAHNYTLTTATAATTGNITKKDVTLTLNAAPLITKVYDGNTTASLAAANYSLQNVISDDDLLVSGTALYDTKDAGLSKVITVNSFVLSGLDLANYNLTTISATTTGNITAKDITLSLNASPEITKVYDGTVSATLVPANYSLQGVETGDVVTVSGTAVYDNKQVGAGKVITVNAFVLTGAQSANYTLTTTTADVNGDITTKQITLALNASPAITKVYDGTLSATLAPANYSLQGVETGDAVTVSGVALYDTKEVGSGKTITAGSFVLAGADLGNYNLNTVTETTTGAITEKPITVILNASPLITKVYDGNAGATLVPANYSLQGLETGDDVTVSGTAAYDNKSVGAGKMITVNGFVLAGTQSSNYTLSTATANVNGDITTKPITLTLNASPVITKQYDGSTEAMLVAANYSLQGIEAGDIVTVSGTGHYDDKNGGTGKTVTANDFILAGSDRNNYNLTTANATTTGSITTRALTVKADDKEKFVGAVNPVFTLSYSGFINGEDESALTVIPAGATVVTQSSPIGTYPITVSGGVSLNYDMTYVPGTLTVKPGAPDEVLIIPVDLYENEAPGALAGTLSATSQDPNASFTYTLVSGLGDADNALFSIQNTNELRTTAALDFEQKQIYSVRIRATTQNNLSLDKGFWIILRDINEVPTMDVISAQEFCYSEEEESILLTGVTAGEETSQSVSLRVRTDNPGLFSSLTVSPVSGSTATLRYRLNDASSIGSAMITVTAQDNGGTANGGIDTIAHSFSLDVYALPVAKIVSEQGTELSKGVTATLVASGGVAYEWSTGDTSASINVRPTVATTYSVIVISEHGCTSMETITLNVLEDYKAVEGTNLMSPNGDGVNDYWVIDNIDMYPNNVVKVFDRAGREIFSQRGYTNTWDATIGGSPLAEGTYFYIVDFGTGADVIKGFITIIRNK